MPGQHTQSYFAIERAAQRENPVKIRQVRTISLSTPARPGHCSQPEQDSESPMLRVPTFQLRGPGEVTQPECLLMWGLSAPLCGRLGRAQRAHNCGRHDNYHRKKQVRRQRLGLPWAGGMEPLHPACFQLSTGSRLFHKQDHFPLDALIRSLCLEC